MLTCILIILGSPCVNGEKTASLGQVSSTLFQMSALREGRSFAEVPVSLPFKKGQRTNSEVGTAFIHLDAGRRNNFKLLQK